jgi:hypothetical protein
MSTEEDVERWSRTVNEYADLRLKLIKLSQFIKSDNFKTLDDREQELLTQQHSSMRNYAYWLNSRLERLENHSAAS